MPVLPVGPLSPYCTPTMLINAPTGISWSSIPPGRQVSPAQRQVEQLNLCMRATAMADSYCNQVLRASLNTEFLEGPGGYRVQIQNSTGNGRILLQRWPVLQVTAVQVANNTFPRVWSPVPAGMFDVENPVVGLYGTSTPSAAGEGGQSVLLAPGYISWMNGRMGYRLQITYLNGWPHASLTAAATAGATSIQVDDCTGWAIPTEAQQQQTPIVTTGATGVIYDSLLPGQVSSAAQEVIQVTASSVPSGPGTLTLAGPLQFAHGTEVLVTTLPESVMWATMMFAASMALTRGATSTTVQSVPGAASAEGKGPSELAMDAQKLLNPFRRVI